MPREQVLAGRRGLLHAVLRADVTGSLQAVISAAWFHARTVIVCEPDRA
jgi:hypothetical protein